MARKQGGTHRSVDDIIGAVLWSEAESGAITLHDDNPRVGGTSLTGDDVRVLVADLTRLRADVARLTRERDAARFALKQLAETAARLSCGHDGCYGESVVSDTGEWKFLHCWQCRAEQAEAERDALRARVWMVEAALKSATAILDGEMGNWREHFHADACVIDAALAPEQEER